MVRLGAWLSIVAVATMQLPWVRCVAKCHDVVHLSFNECPDDHAPQGDSSSDHEDADHESPDWDVAATAARSASTVERVFAYVAPAASGRPVAGVGLVDHKPPVRVAESALVRTTVLLL